MAASDRQILDLIRASLGYKTTVSPVDKGKVQKALDGKPSAKPRSALGEAAWHLALRCAPKPVPPDPPPTTSYKKVAPRVAYKAGGSDARYCLKDFPGLRDDVASYDANGLCLGGRSDGSAADCPTSALEINGREYCSLPTQGDPKLNTGSWLI